MNTRIATPIRVISHPERPSRYRTNMNPTYTSAEPVSLSPRITSIGRAMTAATVRKFENLVSLNPGLLIMNARRREVVIFEISAGWNRTGPKANQDLEPLTSTPRKITATSRNRTIMYSSPAPLSHRFDGMRKTMRLPRPNAVRIHMNCFPLLTLKSRMPVFSPPWMEA